MIDIPLFKSEIPLIAPRLLPDGNATTAVDCSVLNGNLEPVRGHLSDIALEDGTQTIYRIGDQWLQWNLPVSVIPDIVYNDSQRIFISNDGHPKETDITLAFASNAPYPAVTRRLGIPIPETALSFEITTEGTGAANEVSYCYERVGKRNDDTVVRSAPSPSSDVVAAKTDSVVKITGFTDAIEDDVYVSHYWIYRLEVGTTNTEFQFIAEITKDVTEYSDTLTNQSYEILPAKIWSPPVNNLRGLTVGSNGLIFGYQGNVLYVSPPNIPYAFPDDYTLTMPSVIVGLGVIGTVLVVLTKTTPVFVYGTQPGEFSQEPLGIELSCTSERSIVNVRGGVIFASTLGLYLVDASGNAPINITINTFSQTQWSALPIDDLFAFYYNDAYLGFFKGTNQGIEFKVGQQEIRRFRTDRYVWGGRYVSTVSNTFYAWTPSDYDAMVTADGYTFLVRGNETPISYDTLYLIQTSASGGREIIAWEVDDYKDYEWESKEYTLLRKTVLTAGRVKGDFSLGGVTIEIWSERVLLFSKTFTAESKFRMLLKNISSFRINLKGKARIKRILFGESLSSVMDGD